VADTATVKDVLSWQGELAAARLSNLVLLVLRLSRIRLLGA
jgi:hypothetical protein